MTKKELLETLFPEVNLDVNECVMFKCNPEGCNKCKYKNYNYWDEPAVLSKTAVKSILNSIYGYNACFETSTYFVHSDRNIGKTYAQYLELIREGWTKFPSLHNNMDWSMLKDIIDDALDNGFEVKILNGTIYYREKQ